ncbi:MAG: hypothetical protein JWN46_321 [Acidimicrobiales bacterium]|nr:hypothetical protein [Acidimicrobiales bacterium]
MDATPPDAAVERLEGALGALLARVEALEAENRELRASGVPAPVTAMDQEPTTPGPAEPPPTGGGGGLSRRRLLAGGATAAAAGAAGLVAGARPAAAASGSALVLGTSGNLATSPTGTEVDGTGIPYGFGVTDNGYGGAALNKGALFGHAKGTAFNNAAQLLAEGPATGLQVDADSGFGVTIDTSSGLALAVLSSSGSAASFISNSVGETAVFIISSGPGIQIEKRVSGPDLRLLTMAGVEVLPPPSTATADAAGDLLVDTDGPPPNSFTGTGRGNLWFCVAAGTPGTWRNLAGPATAGALHVLHAPVRVYDSRPGTSPSTPPKTPLAAGTPRALDVTANSSGVPKGATAVMCNLLVVNAATGNGNFTIWANGVARPAANNMVWGGSTGRFSSLAVTALDANAKCQVISNVNTDFVLDIVGYYR